MGERSSDKYYYGTPIHQTDPISTGLLAVNESLGFRETSRGPSTEDHLVDCVLPVSKEQYTKQRVFFIALYLIRNLADHFWLINSLISNHWK